MELKRIKELIDLVAASPLGELEVLDHDGWLKLTKQRTPVHAVPSPSGPAPEIVPPIAPPAPSEEAAGLVPAPMTGIFYRAASPGEPPFIEEGVRVSVGQTLALIEAMKTLCKIEAERPGTVRRILVDNGAAVEEGQALFEIA